MPHIGSYDYGRNLSISAEQGADGTPFGSPSVLSCSVPSDLRDDGGENYLHRWP